MAKVSLLPSYYEQKERKSENLHNQKQGVVCGV